MIPPFNLRKTIQAAAAILRNQPHLRTNYMRLIKLLYLANREALRRRGRPICGDTVYAMKRGPVMGNTLNLIKGRDPQASEWRAFIRKDGFDVEIANDPGNLQLSAYEQQIIDEVCEKFAGFDEWELVEYCHNNLAEYKKKWDARPQDKKRVKIPFPDILAEIDRAGQADQIVAELNESQAFSRFFADHEPY